MPPRSLSSKLVKGVLMLELLGLFGAYGLFRKMDSSQDFRNTMNRRLPFVLELYYKSNEMAGVDSIRESDHQAWSAKQD